MNNCERCCFFEACTRLGRIENKNCIYGNKNCIYGNKADKDKEESIYAAHKEEINAKRREKAKEKKAAKAAAEAVNNNSLL